MEEKMNSIDQIISQNDTQKKAVAEIIKLRDRVGAKVAEVEIQQMVKDLKNNRTTHVALDTRVELLRSEKAWNRARTLEYLQKRTPWNMIDKAIADCQEQLDKWATDFKDNPHYALSWGGDAFKNAAKWRVLYDIKRWMIGQGTEEQPDVLTRERWDNIVDHIRNEALSMASLVDNSRSTSQTSNLMDDCVMGIEADMVRSSSWSVIGEINHWFKEMAKLEQE